MRWLSLMIAVTLWLQDGFMKLIEGMSIVLLHRAMSEGLGPYPPLGDDV